MPVTRITNNSLATNAALNNLNAGASITFTKPVSISGNLTVDTNTLFVDSVNNRVGVGTASPQYILDIGAGDVNVGNGSALRWGGTFGIQATSGAMRIDGGAQHIRLTSTGDVSRLYINCSNGNVGIGTTTPNERLTVSGNLSATGTVIASNYNPASNVAEFLASPTSDNLRAAITNETGTEALVFANGPTITSPTIAGTAQFTGTSRPTSTATDTPSTTSLITLADSRVIPHLSRRLFPNMSSSVTGTGATQRRTAPFGVFDGDVSTSAVAGAIYRVNILSPGGQAQTLNSIPATGVVNLSAAWSLFLRGYLNIGTNAHVYLCIGTLGASGIPSTGTGVGFEIESATAIRLFRNNGSAAVFSSSGAITGIGATGAPPTNDFLIWLDNDGQGNLSLFYAVKAHAGSMPLKPLTPLCTLSGVASGIAGSEASIFLRATATSPSVFTALGIRDCIFTEL